MRRTSPSKITTKSHQSGTAAKRSTQAQNKHNMAKFQITTGLILQGLGASVGIRHSLSKNPLSRRFRFLLSAVMFTTLGYCRGAEGLKSTLPQLPQLRVTSSHPSQLTNSQNQIRQCAAVRCAGGVGFEIERSRGGNNFEFRCTNFKN